MKYIVLAGYKDEPARGLNVWWRESREELKELIADLETRHNLVIKYVGETKEIKYQVSKPIVTLIDE